MEAYVIFFISQRDIAVYHLYTTCIPPVYNHLYLRTNSFSLNRLTIIVKWPYFTYYSCSLHLYCCKSPIELLWKGYYMRLISDLII